MSHIKATNKKKKCHSAGETQNLTTAQRPLTEWVQESVSYLIRGWNRLLSESRRHSNFPKPLLGLPTTSRPRPFLLCFILFHFFRFLHWFLFGPKENRDIPFRTNSLAHRKWTNVVSLDHFPSMHGAVVFCHIGTSCRPKALIAPKKGHFKNLDNSFGFRSVLVLAHACMSTRMLVIVKLCMRVSLIACVN